VSHPEYFEEPLLPEIVRKLVDDEFGNMVKFVVDMESRVICVGGGLHSDEEAILLEKGSRQENLWGGNYYPDRPAGEKLAFTSMINIRPRDGNTKQEIQSPDIRRRVEELARHFLGF
jgi:Protein of unknown function (DUF5674)